MNATLKCSNCGSEITNLNMTWGKKQWLWMTPLMILILLPMWKLYKPKGDFRKDLQVEMLELRKDSGNIEILGTIQNNGATEWNFISLNADFFDPQGKFLDQHTERLSNSIPPGDTAHFKITILSPSERTKAKDVRIELKVADASTRMF
jgi:hypothetical protein